MSDHYVLEIPIGDDLEIKRYASLPGITGRTGVRFWRADKPEHVWSVLGGGGQLTEGDLKPGRYYPVASSGLLGGSSIFVCEGGILRIHSIYTALTEMAKALRELNK